MFSTDGILGRNFAVAAAALDGLTMRQKLHAENIANIDTEGYRAKTLDFENVLGAAMTRENPGTMFSNTLGGLSSQGEAFHAGDLVSRFAEKRSTATGVDRSTEVTQMMNDNVRFRVITQQVTNQISAMRSVIAEMGRG